MTTHSNRTATFTKTLPGYGRRGGPAPCHVQLRYDDRCKNGHDTFSITWDSPDMGGCCHDDVREHFPELAHLIQWHLVSDDGPMHYIANTTYHASNGSLEHARSTAVFPNGTLEQLADPELLSERLPALLASFHAAMDTIDWQEG